MPEINQNIQLPFVTSHAFIIGINDYEQVSRLTTAVNDANALAEQLEKQHGYQVHGPLLNATKADILQLIEKDLSKEVGENDRVLFYFAGHGIALDSDDNPKGYLVPADAKPGDPDSLISMDLLHKKITSLPCQHGMLIMDCCFAGAFKWSTGFRDVVFDLPGIIYEERFHQYAQDPAWQVITSSASDQKAVDILSNRTLGLRNEKNTRHSPFAQALLEGLAGEADTVPRDRGDGVITATELYTYLRNRVEDETMDRGKRQSPSMFSLQKHDKGQYIFLSPNHRLNLPPIPKQNPFMGLKSYDEKDGYLFYGRDRAIEALNKLIETNSLVVVSGASGTGKSSVIKAGLLPLLRKRNWQILPIVRPGKEPMQSLQTSLPDLADKMKEVQSSLLIIDQYEELITQCLDPEKRIEFEKQLANWIKIYPQLHIIISIRSDFEPQFEKASLKDYWQKGRYSVPAFSQDELREVIVKPTVQEVLFFEPESLVDKLVDEVNQAPGALPLLSFTLSELYHAYINSGRTNRAFTLEDYEKLGGVIGALRTRANAVYDSLDEVHQNSMRKLMIRMVSLEGGELASRRVLNEDLIFSDVKETERIKKVAQQLIEARLVSSGRDARGETYYEPAHDALVRAWARLWEWIKTMGEEKLRLMYKLSLAITDYRENINSSKAKDYLWNEDPRLDLLFADMKEPALVFNEREEDFLKESMKLRRKNNRQRKIFLGGAIAILALMLFSVYQWNNANFLRGEAERESERANKNAFIAELEKDTANILRIQAEKESIRANNNADEANKQKGIAEQQAQLANSLRKIAEQASKDLAEAQDNFMEDLLEDANNNIERVEHLQALGNLNTINKIGDKNSGLSFRVEWRQKTIEHYYEVTYFFTESGNDGSALESLNGYSDFVEKDLSLLKHLYSISLYNHSKSAKTVDEVKKIKTPCLFVAKYLNREDQFAAFINEAYSPKLKNAVNEFIDEIAEKLPELKSSILKSLWPEFYEQLKQLYFPSFNVGSAEQEDITAKRFGMYWATINKDKPATVNWQDAIDYAEWVSRNLSPEFYLPGVTQRFSSSEYWIREKRPDEEPFIFIAFLPIFYFDNDQPDPRSRKPSTALSYLETAEQYLSKVNQYVTELASEPEELEKTVRFLTELESTIPFLQKELPENIKTVADAGFKLRFETSGFSNRLSGSQYNFILSKRRISAVENYIHNYLPYGSFGDAVFEQTTLGEPISPDIKPETKNSIYHYDNAIQRKVDLTIKVLKKE